MCLKRHFQTNIVLATILILGWPLLVKRECNFPIEPDNGLYLASDLLCKHSEWSFMCDIKQDFINCSRSEDLRSPRYIQEGYPHFRELKFQDITCNFMVF